MVGTEMFQCTFPHAPSLNIERLAESGVASETTGLRQLLQ